MNYSEYFKQNGTLPTFHLEKEEIIMNGKPSSRIFENKVKYKALIDAMNDIEKNHNHSIYAEMKLRSKKYENDEALFYKGTIYSYKEMFEYADKFAIGLANLNLIKGEELILSVSNIPEAVFMFLACNKLGLKFNCFSFEKDSEEFIKEIINDGSKKIFIGTDNIPERILDIIFDSNFENYLFFSLSDSLNDNTEFVKLNKIKYPHLFDFKNNVDAIKSKYKNKKILNKNDFLDIAKNYIEIIDNNKLDTPAIISYTSGSTEIGRSKVIVHTNRAPITMDVFMDSKYSKDPEILGLRSLCNFSLSSNTGITTQILQNLMQHHSVALEPITNVEYILDVFETNRPNIVIITTSYWIAAIKTYYRNPKYYKDGKAIVKFPFLGFCTAAGEPLSLGEERLINIFLKDVSAGKSVFIKKHIHLPFVLINLGGGSTELGGSYYTMFANLIRIKHPFITFKNNNRVGLKPMPFVRVSAFKKIEGQEIYEECDYYENGLLAVNDVTSFKKYKFHNDLVNSVIIRDNTGNEWLTYKMQGYIDKLGFMHIKKNREKNHSNKIDIDKLNLDIQHDYKNILSSNCVLIDEKIYIYVQRQQYSKITSDNLKKHLIKISNIKETIFDENCVIIELPWEDDFPLLPGGKKRDSIALLTLKEKYIK